MGVVKSLSGSPRISSIRYIQNLVKDDTRPILMKKTNQSRLSFLMLGAVPVQIAYHSMEIIDKMELKHHFCCTQ
jgi:hypothetical protein